MVASSNPHEALLAQFKLLPEDTQRRFTADVTNNPDLRANSAQIAAGMQGLINQHVAD